MTTTFYFDPICPFSWITSRWLVQVAAHQPTEINWQPFSLALKNQDQAKDGHLASLRVLRVMYQAQQQHQADMGQLYTSFGQAHHLESQDFSNELIQQVLTQHNLPDSLLISADDSTIDQALQQSIKRATDIAGQDIGVPTMTWQIEQGTVVGFNGPILQSLPSAEESIDIWESLTKLATTPSFHKIQRELKGDLDLLSTK